MVLGTMPGNRGLTGKSLPRKIHLTVVACAKYRKETLSSAEVLIVTLCEVMLSSISTTPLSLVASIKPIKFKTNSATGPRSMESFVSKYMFE